MNKLPFAARALVAAYICLTSFTLCAEESAASPATPAPLGKEISSIVASVAAAEREALTNLEQAAKAISKTTDKQPDILKLKTTPDIKKEELSESAQTLPAIVEQEAAPKHRPLSTEEELRIYTLKTLNEVNVDHDTEYAFGMVGSFTGHFRLYGTTIRNGIMAYFKRINAQGGLHDKRLRLICVDDYGQPQTTGKVIRKLRSIHKIKTFIGNMGARNIAHIKPLIAHKKIALLFPWGGDELVTGPRLKNLINGPGNLLPQLKSLVSYCVNDLLLRKIAIFYSDGTFYTNAKNHIIRILKKYRIKPVAIASYNRFTMDIHTPAKRLKQSDPKVVLCLGSSQPVAKLMSRFFELGHYGTTFIGIDSTMFVPAILRAKGAAYAYTSTVPDPQTSTLQVARDYRHDSQLFFEHDTLNILSFSYYIHAGIIVKALQAVGNNATLLAKIVPQIEAMNNADIGGFSITFNEKTRHAYPQIASIIKG